MTFMVPYNRMSLNVFLRALLSLPAFANGNIVDRTVPMRLSIANAAGNLTMTNINWWAYTMLEDVYGKRSVNPLLSTEPPLVGRYLNSPQWYYYRQWIHNNPQWYGDL